MIKNFTPNQYSLYKKVLGMTQAGLSYSMYHFLSRYYKTIHGTPDYICAEGNIPIALCAHMDTVFPKPCERVFYDKEENVIWSPEGCGHDDRAGVFMIMNVVSRGLRPHIILTTDEELGCIGAGKLAKQPCPFKDLRYIIQLDRRGTDDCVFYWGNNQKFIDYVVNFGFKEAQGSFSDIVALCPEWGMCGVNLSVGYSNEHSQIEHLDVTAWNNTLTKVIKMLKNPPKTQFEYTEAPAPGFMHWFNNSPCKCDKCGDMIVDDDIYPVIALDGTTKNFCIECMLEGVNWCVECNRPFESKNINETICCKCKEKEKK